MPRRRRRTDLPAPTALLLGLLLVLTACGGDDEPRGDEKPSAKATECREQWRDLADEVEGRDTATTPSTLPARWNSIAAATDYYARSATEDDCGDTLTAQEEAITALESYNTKLARFDLELELADVREDAEEYADSPAPSPSPAPKGKKDRKKPRPKAPPSPAAVEKALATLTTQAPLATEQQDAGWQQAAVIDLADKVAVAKSLKDLVVISGESPAYRSGKAALVVIKKGLTTP